MKILIEYCWGRSHHFRCVMPDGSRLLMDCDNDPGVWTRKHASQLRDFAVRQYGVRRSAVKAIIR